MIPVPPARPEDLVRRLAEEARVKALLAEDAASDLLWCSTNAPEDVRDYAGMALGYANDVLLFQESASALTTLQTERDGLEESLGVVLAEIQQAQIPTSVKEACGEGIYDRAQRAGLKWAENIVAAHISDPSRTTALRHERERRRTAEDARRQAEATVARLEGEKEEVKRQLQPIRCRARLSYGDPTDCDWPACGCDPHAARVVEALQESEWRSPKQCDELVQEVVEDATDGLRSALLTAQARITALAARLEAASRRAHDYGSTRSVITGRWEECANMECRADRTLLTPTGEPK